ncbi:MAG: type I restriction-modification system subunit M N-terminal domain-containing protein [Chitinophagaceae bacterium]|nr:type I restriction-modification system subunit M N-terminal domain-containing protein [Chitinophagaceae bacterium]
MAKLKKEIEKPVRPVRAQKPEGGKAIEVTLWEAANKLRGSVEPAEYKHVVLGLIF